MTRFTITLLQTVVEKATVTVEADNLDAAKQAAVDLGNDGKVTWEFCECPDPIEVYDTVQLAI